MYYELALISVAIAGAYWGWFFIRREVTRLYGVMLAGSAALSALGLYGHKQDIDSLGIAGAIGVGAGTCLLIVGPFVRGLARRAAGAERFAVADRLLTIAEVLAPGSGVSDERALVGAMREIRDGNIEGTIEALTHAKRRAPDEAKLAIDERIAMLYLASYRWEDAIAHAEAHLFGELPAPEGGPHVALRRALGIAPPVWVELLGAYGYQGNLDQAARMLARLEEVCAGRDDAGIWVHRGRLMFLALAGRPDAVRALVEPRRSRHMTPAARTYWVAVAHERHGDAAVAEAAYVKARSRSRGRPRLLIDQALARLPTAKPPALGDDAKEIMARAETAPVPAVVERARRQGPTATRILVAALILPALAITLLVGDTTDIGVLFRAGALVRSLVHAEPWRLVSCIFIHVGSVHLLVNVMGLWFLGRLAEDLFGSWRMVAIFALSGLAGSTASYFASPAGISAGASGAIMGVVGALFVELTLGRKRHRAAWSRGLWGSLVLVIAGQVLIGLFFPIADQWAHAGGLFAGAVLGLVFSPQRRHVDLLARIVAVAFAAATIVSAVLVARTSVAESLTRRPSVDHVIKGVTVRIPADWIVSGGSISDPQHLITFAVDRGSGAIDAQLADELERAKHDGFTETSRVVERLVVVPDGWTSAEVQLGASDAMDTEQQFRLVVAERAGIVTALYVPETLARQAPSVFSALYVATH